MHSVRGLTLSDCVSRGGREDAAEEGSAGAHQLGCVPLRKALQLHEQQLALMPPNHNCVLPQSLYSPDLRAIDTTAQLWVCCSMLSFTRLQGAVI